MHRLRCAAHFDLSPITARNDVVSDGELSELNKVLVI